MHHGLVTTCVVLNGQDAGPREGEYYERLEPIQEDGGVGVYWRWWKSKPQSMCVRAHGMRVLPLPFFELHVRVQHRRRWLRQFRIN